MDSKLKILFKYPSRGRKEMFFKSLDSLVNNLYDLDNFQISVTLDTDDAVMNTPEVIEKIEKYPNTHICWGLSSSKVHAINRDLPEYGDIIIVHSDDMMFTFFGFDEIVRQEFAQSGLNTLLHIPDNDAKHILATMYIAGRNFFEERGYIYNPIYDSLFCDDAIQEIAKRTNRYRFANYTGLIFHANPAYGHQPKDDLFLQQQETGWSKDQATFFKDKANNFGL